MEVTVELLEAARHGLSVKRNKIDAMIKEIDAEIGIDKKNWASPDSDPVGEILGAKRTMSPAGRARIAAAQRKRWADKKNGKPLTIQAAKPVKRKLSAKARANIVKATKARWAAYRANKAKAA